MCDLRRRAEGGYLRHCLGTCSQTALLRSAEYIGLDFHPAFDIQCAYALGCVDLVTAYRDHVRTAALCGEGQLHKCLHRIRFAETQKQLSELRAYTAERLTSLIPQLVLIGGGAPHILSVSLPGWRSEVLMNFLEADGIFVSRSSACKKGARSHVLEAIGLPAKVIDGALRISFSRYNTTDDADALCASLLRASQTLAHR